MLNGLKAELYKAVHRKYLWVLLAVVLALESLVAGLWVGPWRYEKLVSLMASFLMVGCILTIPLGDLVMSEPLKSGTVKNETAFGIPRSRIYLTKLTAAAMVSLLFCAAVYAWYLTGGLLFTDHSDAAAVRASLEILAWVTAAALPLWLGCLGLVVALLMLTRSPAAVVAGVSTFLLVAIALDIVVGTNEGEVGKVAGVLLELLPTTPFVRFEGALTRELMAWCWQLGLGWLVGSTAAGLAAFSRRNL